jgi:phosphotransferase system  glucose/maltose/N-acetylglucosamine-specific IIC component
MHHGPAQDSGPDPASRYKSRLGVGMFIVYCLVYAGFVFTNVLTEGRAMQTIVVAGLNLAVVYGMGLIIFALVLALIYNYLCTAKEKELAGGAPRGEVQE